MCIAYYETSWLSNPNLPFAVLQSKTNCYAVSFNSDNSAEVNRHAAMELTIQVFLMRWPFLCTLLDVFLYYADSLTGNDGARAGMRRACADIL